MWNGMHERWMDGMVIERYLNEIDGCMDAWLDGCMDGCMDEVQIVRRCVCTKYVRATGNEIEVTR